MPPRRTSPKGYKNARSLRKNLTAEELRLWSPLRGDRLGASFRRQHAIGPYIVDFCCIKKRLIIELDGGQHIDQCEYDNERTANLAALGYRVLRFWNHDVNTDLDSVLVVIIRALDEFVDHAARE